MHCTDIECFAAQKGSLPVIPKPGLCRLSGSVEEQRQAMIAARPVRHSLCIEWPQHGRVLRQTFCSFCSSATTRTFVQIYAPQWRYRPGLESHCSAVDSDKGCVGNRGQQHWQPLCTQSHLFPHDAQGKVGGLHCSEACLDAVPESSRGCCRS